MDIVRNQTLPLDTNRITICIICISVSGSFACLPPSLVRSTLQAKRPSGLKAGMPLIVVLVVSSDHINVNVFGPSYLDGRHINIQDCRRVGSWLQ